MAIFCGNVQPTVHGNWPKGLDSIGPIAASSKICTSDTAVVLRFAQRASGIGSTEVNRWQGYCQLERQRVASGNSSGDQQQTGPIFPASRTHHASSTAHAIRCGFTGRATES